MDWSGGLKFRGTGTDGARLRVVAVTREPRKRADYLFGVRLRPRVTDLEVGGVIDPVLG